MTETVKIGVGGPVGAGKTQLIEKLVKQLSKEFSIGVITNDIYTKEDEKILVNSGVLPADRIIGSKQAAAHIQQFVKMLQ